MMFGKATHFLLMSCFFAMLLVIQFTNIKRIHFIQLATFWCNNAIDCGTVKMFLFQWKKNCHVPFDFIEYFTPIFFDSLNHKRDTDWRNQLTNWYFHKYYKRLLNSSHSPLNSIHFFLSCEWNVIQPWSQ